MKTKILGLIVIILILAGLGAAYQFRLFNRAPKAEFSYRTPMRALKYINPNSDDMILFVNTSSDPDGDPLSYSWFVNNTLQSKDRDFQTKLPPGTHSVRVVASDGRTQSTVDIRIEVDPAHLPQYSERKLRIPIKGIAYNAGIRDWKSMPVPPEDQMKEDLYVIKNELGCNGIRIIGDHDEVLLKCAEIAISLSYDVVMLSPRYLDLNMNETIDKVSTFVKKFLQLSRTSDRLVLCVEQELTLDSTEWINLPTITDRSAHSLQHPEKIRENSEKLHLFLIGIRKALPPEYKGKTTYAKGSWEEVRWNELSFDIVGSNEYYGRGHTNQTYVNQVRRLRIQGKPLFVTEFGAATFEGAFGTAGSGWLHTAGKSYNQSAQAQYIGIYLELLQEAAVDGIFLWQFRDSYPDRTQSPSLIEGKSRKLSFYVYKSYSLVNPSSMPKATQDNQPLKPHGLIVSAGKFTAMTIMIGDADRSRMRIEGV